MHNARSSPLFTVTACLSLSPRFSSDPPYCAHESRLASFLRLCYVLGRLRLPASPPVSARVVLPVVVQRVIDVRHHSTQRLVCSTARVLPLFLQLCFLVSASVLPCRTFVPPLPLFRGYCCQNCYSSSTFCLCNNR
ncbi:hypothetical protein AHAS_Ahas02G0072600 [Arachis hypogaea]